MTIHEVLDALKRIGGKGTTFEIKTEYYSKYNYSPATIHDSSQVQKYLNRLLKDGLITRTTNMDRKYMVGTKGFVYCLKQTG